MLLSGNKLILRVDATTQMGMGHVMRCLALAQQWQDKGGESIFITAYPSSSWESLIKQENSKILHLTVDAGSLEDVRQTAEAAKGEGASWVVVDGYQFPVSYQRAVKETGIKLLWIDDTAQAEHYYADLVLNQNLYANENLYRHKKESYVKLLLGTRYVLLRNEFSKWRDQKRRFNDTTYHILVTMGGGDPHNVTLKALQALQEMQKSPMDVVAVVGANNPHYEVLTSAVLLAQFPVRLERNVRDISELMAWADVAVASAGCTAWELAFMGLPSILLALALNQKPVAEALHQAGVSINLGRHEDITEMDIRDAVQDLLADSDKRRRMGLKGKMMVDGNGAIRVVEKINFSLEAVSDLPAVIPAKAGISKLDSPVSSTGQAPSSLPPKGVIGGRNDRLIT